MTQHESPLAQANAPHFYPILTIALIVVNTGIFLALHLIDPNISAETYRLYGGMYPPAVSSGEWYRLITCTFLHSNSYHLFNNCIMIFAVGRYIEKAMGKFRFSLVYFSSGFFGSLLSFLFNYSGDIVSIGASGAAFGLIGSLCYIVLYHKGRYDDISIRGLLLMILLSLYFGFTSINIDNAGHIGGLFSGFLLSVFLYHPKKQGIC